MRTASPLLNATPTITPWYRQRWPWLLMLGPALVVLAGAFTPYLAYTRQDAMVVDDYYKQGKAINQDLRRDRAATMLRLSWEARYDPARGALSGQLRSFERPYGRSFKLYLAHATLPELDIARDVTPDADGRFVVQVGTLARARWQAVVESGERDWRLAGAWHWPQQATVLLRADGAVVQTGDTAHR